MLHHPNLRTSGEPTCGNTAGSTGGEACTYSAPESRILPFSNGSPALRRRRKWRGKRQRFSGWRSDTDSSTNRSSLLRKVSDRNNSTGRVVILVNEHTLSAGEMVAAFAQENGLATIIGAKTSGRLLSGVTFKVGFGYMVGLPVAAFLTREGRLIEGKGVARCQR